jgi:ArsR family transcriptional regulator, virulence genes transcriptional regulator
MWLASPPNKLIGIKMNFSTNDQATPAELCAENGSVILKSMANRHRLLILCSLKEREYSVGELEKVVGLSQSALSQHLARLRKDNLVQTRRSAQMIYYQLPDNHARKILESMFAIFVESGSSQAVY